MADLVAQEVAGHLRVHQGAGQQPVIDLDPGVGRHLVAGRLEIDRGQLVAGPVGERWCLGVAELEDLP